MAFGVLQDYKLAKVPGTELLGDNGMAKERSLGHSQVVQHVAADFL